jgi:hypothetical protein
MTKRKIRAYARNRAKDQRDGDAVQGSPAAIGPLDPRSTGREDAQVGGIRGDCAPSISAQLGMGRVDPFRTYARETTHFEDAMIDECEHTL